MAETSPNESVIGRRKVKTACIPCKDRKRKCDGKLPCSTCLRYEYECQYSKTTPKTRNAQEPKKSPPQAAPSLSEEIKQGHSSFSVAEATSGVAFSNAVASKNAVAQTSTAIGWNLGPPSVSQSSEHSLLQPVPISTLISENEILEEARKYYFSVGTLYPMLSLQTSFVLIRSRYDQSTQELQPLVDATLSAMAALSHSFSGGVEHEYFNMLLKNAQLCFSLCSDDDPTELHVVAWSLYTILLRAFGTAHACWMASCTTIHLIDAISASQKQGHDEFSLSNDEKQSLYWTSRLAHMWISFELGRPHILSSSTFADDQSLSSIVNKHLLSVLSLYVSTRLISPDPSVDYEKLEQSFASIEGFSCSGNDALELSRCILAMTTFRRRLIQHPPITPSLKARMIAIGREGLLSVERLLESPAPWWHLAHVPLQLLCLLLVIGALPEIPHAIRALRAVAAAHPTDRVKETLIYAEHILQAIYAQRLTDCRLLEEALGLNGTEGSFANINAGESNLPFDLSWNLPVALDDLNWDLFPNSGTSIFDPSLYG